MAGDQVVCSFTSTRKGLTAAQLSKLSGLLIIHRVAVFVHGDCVGGDDQGHELAHELGLATHARPSTHQLRAHKAADTVYLPEPPLARNRKIVDDGQLLIACPDGPERPRSGTWATIRYAIRLGRPTYIIYPDGRLETRCVMKKS
jgi:hypothetical protein